MYKKRFINLVPAIKELEAKIREIRLEYLETVMPYEDSLRELRKLNTACERCNGTGKILRSRSCAEDYRPDPNDPADYVRCMRCGGTGIALEVEEENRPEMMDIPSRTENSVSNEDPHVCGNCRFG